MAGEASRNPNSPQFTGELPDVQPGGAVTWIVQPSKAFLEQVGVLREAGVAGPIRCEEADQDVILVALASWTVPLRTSREWPVSNLQMAELARMPLVEFKKQHKANFARSGMAAADASILIPEEKKIEV